MAALCIACAPKIPQNTPVDRVEWLQQGWSEAERRWFHHAGQGTRTLPVRYDWLMALEQPELTLREAERFTDPDHLRRFGFIPSPASESDGPNPGGLPVGFARLQTKNPIPGEPPLDHVGFTCAACHTGHLEYDRVSIRFDGGPAMTNLYSFRESLGVALGLTDRIPGRFDRFADEVLGEKASQSERDDLRAELKDLIDKGKRIKEIEKSGGSTGDVEGFARLDALTRIGNQVFFRDLYDLEQEPDTDGNTAAAANYDPIVAPVNFPHIWRTSWFDWVQYDASIMQPMTRNAGEALGVSAIVNLGPNGDLYASTLPVDTIYQLEAQLAGKSPWEGREPKFKGLEAPKWPATILGGIDTEKAKAGSALYAKYCQRCHGAPVGTSEFWDESKWTRPNQAGERYLKMPLDLPGDDVETDPGQAQILVKRQVNVPARLGMPPVPEGDLLCYDADSMQGAETRVPFAWALGVVVEKTVTRWYDKHDKTPAQREKMNGNRPNCLQAKIGYKARPLDGIWATAPYLHNGSVPNLYALLSPVDERPKRFYLGSRLFDPELVGYDTSRLKGGFELDTSKTGNSNQGHEFTDEAGRPGRLGRGFTEEERRQLVEFLKTL